MSFPPQVPDWKQWGLLIYVVPQSNNLYVAAVKTSKSSWSKIIFAWKEVIGHEDKLLSCVRACVCVRHSEYQNKHVTSKVRKRKLYKYFLSHDMEYALCHQGSWHYWT